MSEPNNLTAEELRDTTAIRKAFWDFMETRRTDLSGVAQLWTAFEAGGMFAINRVQDMMRDRGILRQPECPTCRTVLAFPGDECGLCKCSSLCAPGESCALTESGVCKENKNE